MECADPARAGKFATRDSARHVSMHPCGPANRLGQDKTQEKAEGLYSKTLPNVKTSLPLPLFAGPERNGQETGLIQTAPKGHACNCRQMR